MQMILASVKFLKFEMDQKNIDYEQTASGEPYVLIPTLTLMETEGKRSRRGLIRSG